MPDAADPSYDETGPARTRLVALPVLRARHNLPAQISSFVGRESELTEIARLLRKHRLVSLTGPGGAGKTRLALVAAGELVEVFDDGVWLVELAPLTDPALVTQTVAGALEVREQPGRPLTRVLRDYLATRRLLLVLDNCEHLVDACAVLVENLLHACPDLHVLTTSRESLSIPGEIASPVPALDLASEAARLFADRATAVNPGFALTAETAPAVAAICARLDGMPLAIELAAAQTRMLTVQEIADGLDDGFSLNAEGPRTADSRHRTLHAASTGVTIYWPRQSSCCSAGWPCSPADSPDRPPSGSAPERVWSNERCSVCSHTWWTSRSWLSAPNTASRGTCSRRSSGSTRTMRSCGPRT